MNLDTPQPAVMNTYELWNELSNTAKRNAYTLTDAKHTAITMIVKTMLSFAYTATRTTCTLVSGLMDMCLLDMDEYVRPLCRKTVEYQYWCMRIFNCKTATALGETMNTHGKDIVHMMDTSTQSVRNQVETIYVEELSKFRSPEVKQNSSIKSENNRS